MADKIRLQPITYEIFNEVIKLSVSDKQKTFVASNLYSLAEAYATTASGGYALPFGIYLDDKAIGFLMIGYVDTYERACLTYPEDEGIPGFVLDAYAIWRFMIDSSYQHKGYGKLAFQLALDFIRTQPLGPASTCWLSYEPENTVAKDLYASFGFCEIEMPQNWDEVPAVLSLS